VVHDVERAEGPARGQRVAHEVHRPPFVRPRGHRQHDARRRRPPPPLPAPHRELLLAVEAIDAFVVAHPPLALEQHVQPPIAPARRQARRRPPGLPDRVVAAPAYVPDRRPRYPQRVTRSALADAEPVLHTAHGLTASDGRHHFRDTTALSIWLSSVRSATSVFSRR